MKFESILKFNTKDPKILFKALNSSLEKSDDDVQLFYSYNLVSSEENSSEKNSSIILKNIETEKIEKEKIILENKKNLENENKKKFEKINLSEKTNINLNENCLIVTVKSDDIKKFERAIKYVYLRVSLCFDTLNLCDEY